MKRKLLFVSSLLFGISANAQFTTGNAPQVNDSITLFLVDSLAPNMASVVGQNAVWDYSNMSGYNSTTRFLKVHDPSATANSSYYPSAGEALEFENVLTTFTAEISGGRESYGFVMNDPAIGQILGVFDNGAEPLYTYPMDLNNSVNGSFAGYVNVDFGMGNNNYPLAGNITATVDGVGTLKLSENDYTGVMRYKLEETIIMSVNLGLATADIDITRTQYEYYDHTISNLPIFIHSTVDIVPPPELSFIGMTATHNVVVVSLEDPDASGGTNPDPVDGFVSTNAPEIGNQITLFTIDSLATDLGAVTGAGAVWDYSNVAGYGANEKHIVKVEDAAATNYASTFNTSAVALEIEDFYTTYFTNNATERESQGFIFKEPGLGDVVGRLDDNHSETLYTYPFVLNSVANSSFQGTVTLNLGGLTTLGLTGTATAEVDGKGTLKLANSDYTDVWRYKLVDNMVIALDSANPAAVVNITRTQYEYYDFTEGKLPLLIHSNITFGEAGGGESGGYSLVLSYELPSGVVSVKENILEETVLYPNPATEELNIQLPNGITHAEIEVLDIAGRSVYSSTFNSSTEKINTAHLNQGTYFVKILSGQFVATKKIIIK